MPSKNKQIKNETNKRYYHKNKKRLREEQRIRSSKDYKIPEKRQKKLEASKRWRLNNPEQALLLRTKYSAKRRGLLFDLVLEDIKIPESCPLLGIKLECGGKESNMNSPSIDRIYNTKGYTKDNIWIISTRANKLKSDSSLNELELLVQGLRHKINFND